MVRTRNTGSHRSRAHFRVGSRSAFPARSRRSTHRPGQRVPSRADDRCPRSCRVTGSTRGLDRCRCRRRCRSARRCAHLPRFQWGTGSRPGRGSSSNTCPAGGSRRCSARIRHAHTGNRNGRSPKRRHSRSRERCCDTLHSRHGKSRGRERTRPRRRTPSWDPLRCPMGRRRCSRHTRSHRCGRRSNSDSFRSGTSTRARDSRRSRSSSANTSASSGHSRSRPDTRWRRNHSATARTALSCTRGPPDIGSRSARSGSRQSQDRRTGRCIRSCCRRSASVEERRWNRRPSRGPQPNRRPSRGLQPNRHLDPLLLDRHRQRTSRRLPRRDAVPCTPPRCRSDRSNRLRMHDPTRHRPGSARRSGSSPPSRNTRHSSAHTPAADCRRLRSLRPASRRGGAPAIASSCS